MPAGGVSAEVQGLAGQPVGSLVLDSVPLDELRAVLDGLPYADEIVERVVAAYQPGRTMGEAFRLLLSGLLGGRGLLFLDPLDPRIREIAAPFLLEAFERADELSAAVTARDAELKNAGCVASPGTCTSVYFASADAASMRQFHIMLAMAAQLSVYALAFGSS